MQAIESAVRKNREAVQAKLLAKSIPVTETGCWLWTAGTSKGYGYVKLTEIGNNCGAHRVSFCAFKDEALVEGMHIHHKCNTPLCINPDHLDQVTPLFNTLVSAVSTGAVNARKTVCRNGHSLAGDNLYVYGAHRHCRKCRYEQTMRYYSTRTTVAARGRTKCQ